MKDQWQQPADALTDYGVNEPSDPQEDASRFGKLFTALRGSRLRSRACWIAACYALFATFWIYFSDHALNSLLGDPDAWVRWSVFKGIGFVAVTSILLWLLMRKAFGALESSCRSLRAQTQQLHEHEQQLATVLSSAMDAIVTVDARGRILIFNKAAERVFECPAHQALGRPVSTFLPAVSSARGLVQEPSDTKTTSHAGSEPGDTTLSWEGKRIDGGTFPVEVSISKVESRSQRVTTFIIRDIRRRKFSEELVAAQNRILSMIAGGSSLSDSMDALIRFLESQSPEMKCSVLLLDQDGTHLRHGAAPSLPDAYSRFVDGSAIGPDAGSCGTAAWRREPVFVQDISSDPLWENYREHALPHGLHACWSSPILDADNEVLGTFAVYYMKPGLPTSRHRRLVDIATQLAAIAIGRWRVEKALAEARSHLESEVEARTYALRQALVRAEAADRLKSAFLATMSHELRTPLNSIIGFTGIVLQGLAGPLNAEQAKQLSIVRGSARHLLELINDVLDLSKIEAGQLEMRLETFDLVNSIQNMVAMVRPMAEKKDLLLETDIQAVEIEMLGDSRRVEQILLNLLNNAIKFTDRGRIRISAQVRIFGEETQVTDPSVCVTVEDTGIGICPSDIALLFQPFRQLDTGLTRQREGTGLGLAICQKLTTLMGGRITVESELGQGSTFTLVLPMEPSEKRRET